MIVAKRLLIFTVFVNGIIEVADYSRFILQLFEIPIVLFSRLSPTMVRLVRTLEAILDFHLSFMTVHRHIDRPEEDRRRSGPV